MAVDASSLLARFPEFTEANTEYPSLVSGAIADAELLVDRVVWGDKADMGVTHLAAHFIAINPLGELARLDKRGEENHLSVVFRKTQEIPGVGGLQSDLMPSKPGKIIIRDTDKGWKRVEEETKPNFKYKYVAVGVYGAKAVADHGGLPNIKIAATHEFGAKINHPGGTAYYTDGGSIVFVANSNPISLNLPRTKPHLIEIPERSFIRSTADKRRKQIVAISKNLAVKVLDGSMSREKALETNRGFRSGRDPQAHSQRYTSPACAGHYQAQKIEQTLDRHRSVASID